MLRPVRYRNLRSELRSPAARCAGFALALATGMAIACGAAEGESEASGSAAASEVAAAAGSRSPPARAPERKERPLPAFSGWTLDKDKLSISSLIGKRLLIYFFDPGFSGTPAVTDAVVNVSKLRLENNFRIVGVAVRSNRGEASEFVREHGIDFPVIDDSSGAIARRLGLRSPLALLSVDAEGYVVFGMLQFPTDEHASEVIDGQIRQALRLPALAGESEPTLGNRPEAPLFTAEVLDSDERFDLAAHKGMPVVLVFFLHTCPHCHEALGFLKEALAAIPEEQRPQLLGIEVSGRTAAVRGVLRDRNLDFFPVAFDPDGSIRAAYGSFAGVPDTFLIDRDGRIVARVQGWRPRHDPPLLRMRLARIAGAETPMLLRSQGYSGNEVCGVCHELEHETWQFTTHASAFDTLLKHGEETDPECVSCHVVGYEQPGGFVSSQETPDLEHVGCETCHGRGGPHLSPDFLRNGDYAPVCVQCHDTKHSLGFDYAAFVPRVSHAKLEYVTKLPFERKQALAERGVPRANLLPGSAAHVGSDACQSCHEAEYATWAAAPHARAVASLAKDGHEGDVTCLACHTTGYGRDGGFPSGGGIAEHRDLARVGCESCHGPGGDHVGENATRIGTIVSLSDKCDSCVILQICGRCHDDENDPGFEFEVQAKIEAQRHGTIEPGTGQPKATNVRPGGGADASGSTHGLLGHAFALMDQRRQADRADAAADGSPWKSR
jgi:peroxiredoxin